MTDYKSLLEDKTREYEQLSEQLAEFEQQSNLIINELEEELKQVKKKNQMLTREINEHKEKSKCFKSAIERQVEVAQRERNQFKKNFMEFERKVIELEIVNENLESQLRATKSTLAQYESRTEKTMEELAIVRCEFEQSNESNKEAVARLRDQLKETEEELYAIRQIRQKKEQEKEKERMNSLGESQIVASEITVPNSNAFKQTLKGIRQYMAGLDTRKAQIRKMILKV